MNVLLALPTAGHPTAPFLESLRTLDLPPSVERIEHVSITGNFIPGQRELAVRRALALGVDVLIMIDDDMIVPPHALHGILGALDADPELAIVGALYYSRDGLRPMTATHWVSHDTTTAAIPAFGHDVARVDAVGFGCVGIRIAALRALTPPYVGAHVYLEESSANVRICNEDYLLCERMRDIGYGIGLHGGVRCKHYDRASATAQPAMWEDDAATAVERMLVAEPGPHYRLIPYDPSGARINERHAAVPLTYLFVD